MTVELRAATPDDWPAIVAAEERGFTEDHDEARLAEFAELYDASRFTLAVERGAVVGVAGSIAFELTVPGGASVPVAGLTWVSVLPTHRRQGILTRMIDHQHRAALDRDEVGGVLTASEATIYGRFGYGPATFLRQLEVRSARARLRDDAPAGGTCRFAGVDEAAVVPPLFEAHRRRQAGEVSRTPAWWARWQADPPFLHVGMTRQRVVVHWDEHGVADGYCTYRGVHGGSGDDQRAIEVTGLVALTPAAHAELWRFLVSVDLVDVVRTWRAPVDDPLPVLLTDLRAVHERALGDHLWLAPLRPAPLLRARAMASDDEVVVEVAGTGRFTVTAGDTRPTDRFPEVTLGPGELGMVLLGGTPVATLARAGRVVEHRPGAVAALGRLLATDRAPLLSTSF